MANLYTSTQKYEILDLDIATDEELAAWDQPRPDATMPNHVAVRPTGSPTRVVAVLSPDDFAVQYTPVTGDDEPASDSGS